MRFAEYLVIYGHPPLPGLPIALHVVCLSNPWLLTPRVLPWDGKWTTGQGDPVKMLLICRLVRGDHSTIQN